MSNLPGNPHATAAAKRLDGVHDWQAEEGQTDATMQALTLDALTEATLALAFEQRTANIMSAAALAICVDGPTVDLSADLTAINGSPGLGRWQGP